MLALANNELEISEYSALEIKRAVTGTGRATKQQIQHMVRVLLGMDRNPPQDAADALACAICHLHLSQGEKRRVLAESETVGSEAGGVRS
jgi:crossover junction endodeoxyribonuclease RuvC